MNLVMYNKILIIPDFIGAPLSFFSFFFSFDEKKKSFSPNMS